MSPATIGVDPFAELAAVGPDKDEKLNEFRLVRLSLESKVEANKALAAGSFDRAAELYKRGVQRLEEIDFSEHADAKSLLVTLLLNLSLCRLRMDDPRRARNAASRALTLEPTSEKGLYRRADAALRMGDHDEAEADISTLLASFPHNTAAPGLLRDVRSRRRAAAATTREQAVRAMVSGSLYEEQSACAQPECETEAVPPLEQSQEPPHAKAPLDWEKAASDKLFEEGSRDLYDDDSGFSFPAFASREPVSLPPNWEAIREEGGAEVWRLKGSE